MILATRLAAAAMLALAAAGYARGTADAGPAAMEQGAEPPSTTLAAPVDTRAPESAPEPEAPTSGEGQGEGESAEETPATATVPDAVELGAPIGSGRSPICCAPPRTYGSAAVSRSPARCEPGPL